MRTTPRGGSRTVKPDQRVEGAGRFEVRLVHARRFGKEPVAQNSRWLIAPATIKDCAPCVAISSCNAASCRAYRVRRRLCRSALAWLRDRSSAHGEIV